MTWRTADFDFNLPKENIAQTAMEPRDHARLLHVAPHARMPFSDHHVYDLPKLLRTGDILVVNNSRVIPARLFGRRGTTAVEILLHKAELETPARLTRQVWTAFARPGKKLVVGDLINFAEDFSAVIIEKRAGGELLLGFDMPRNTFRLLLLRHGEPPLPPYIHRARGQAKNDAARYQTIYAEHDGSVAAPTAGLHFTSGLLAELETKNIRRLGVTLHVGAGTFMPIKVEHVADHHMHEEWGEITPETANVINQAKIEGRRIVAVGTTSLRLLESATDASGVVHPYAKSTDIFIFPGYKFRCVDALMTNFHLPQSTLFMLVSAFAGLDTMRRAYSHAIAEKYRFYSYGDTTLLEQA